MSFGILRPERRKIQVNFPGYRSIPRAAPQKKPVRAFLLRLGRAALQGEVCE